MRSPSQTHRSPWRLPLTLLGVAGTVSFLMAMITWFVTSQRAKEDLDQALALMEQRGEPRSEAEWRVQCDFHEFTPPTSVPPLLNAPRRPEPLEQALVNDAGQPTTFDKHYTDHPEELSQLLEFTEGPLVSSTHRYLILDRLAFTRLRLELALRNEV